jgi:hypothetical protein
LLPIAVLDLGRVGAGVPGLLAIRGFERAARGVTFAYHLCASGGSGLDAAPLASIPPGRVVGCTGMCHRRRERDHSGPTEREHGMFAKKSCGVLSAEHRGRSAEGFVGDSHFWARKPDTILCEWPHCVNGRPPTVNGPVSIFYAAAGSTGKVSSPCEDSYRWPAGPQLRVLLHCVFSC